MIFSKAPANSGLAASGKLSAIDVIPSNLPLKSVSAGIAALADSTSVMLPRLSVADPNIPVMFAAISPPTIPLTAEVAELTVPETVPLTDSIADEAAPVTPEVSGAEPPNCFQPKKARAARTKGMINFLIHEEPVEATSPAALLTELAAPPTAPAAEPARFAAPSAAGAVGGAASSVGNAAGDVASSGTSWIKKLIIPLVLAALAFFGWKQFGGSAPDVSGAASSAMEKVSGMAGGDMSANITGMFGSATESLSGITDVESAKAAIPALTDFSGKLDGVVSMADSLPDAAKPILAGALEKLMPMLDKVMAIPGVGAVLGSVIEPLKEKLTGLAG